MAKRKSQRKHSSLSSTGGGRGRGRGREGERAKRQKIATTAGHSSDGSDDGNDNGNIEIYRDNNTGRIYYGSYEYQSNAKVEKISVGDVVAAVLPPPSSSSASDLPKKKKGRPSNKAKGDGDMNTCIDKTSWKTCEILAMYKNAKKRRKSTRSSNTSSSRTITSASNEKQEFSELRLKVRYFERAQDIALDDFQRVDSIYSIEKQNDKDNDGNSRDKDDNISTLEEVYETDFIGEEIGIDCILPVEEIEMEKDKNEKTKTINNRQYRRHFHEITMKSTCTSISQYCRICVSTSTSLDPKNKNSSKSINGSTRSTNNSKNNKNDKTTKNTHKLYSFISLRSGKCHLDHGLHDSIQRFQEKKMSTNDTSSPSFSSLDKSCRNWFYRFCRGIQCLKVNSADGDADGDSINITDSFTLKTLGFVYQRIEEYNEKGNKKFHTNLNQDEIVIIDDSPSRSENSAESDTTSKSISETKKHTNTNTTDTAGATTTRHTLNKNECLSPTSTSSKSRSASQRCGAAATPFHVDVSDLKAFYSAIEIDIPWETFEDPYNKDDDKKVSCGDNNKANHSDKDETWKLCIGDTVAVHVDERSQKKSEEYPFSVQWCPAEIICIYTNLDDRTEAARLREGLVADRRRNKGMQVTTTNDDKMEEDKIYYAEIRWLYRKHDIPGIVNRKFSERDINGTEEIFETDAIYEIEISSLVGKVALYSDPKRIHERISISPSGMPVVNFFCHQLWSLHRKTLMPVGSMENRVQRGMMYSKYMGRDSATRAALGGVSLKDFSQEATLKEKKDWKHLFHESIAKLTLAESSAIGNDDEYNIIGREKERKQISLFLKSAIEAANEKETTNQMNSNMFVLFIGGAPGTGKTASVKSIVYHFNKEQAEGKIPSFEFVGVNGMEMRHPFDVYVRLWEAVSYHKSNRKEVCPAEKALANLEVYFARKRKNRGTTKRKVFVVLVDEIDYLVMKKQTVLYNLFDWPNRGFSEKSSGQLIVLGISNTLNLPERLHARLQSRIGRDRCMYASYGIDESINILKGKLGITGSEKSIFHPDAIKFAARKISSESGDIRKVFHLCKAAAENVCNEFESGKRQLPVMLQSYQEVVNISDIQKASQKMFNSVIHQGVADATDMEALLFVSLASLQKQWARSKGGFGLKDVVTKMEGVASSFGDRRYLPSPTCSELLRMLNRLGEARVISLHTPNGTIRAFNTMITLELNEHGVLSALKDTYHKKLAERFLSGSLFRSSSY